MTAGTQRRYTPLSVAIHASPVLRALRAAARNAADKFEQQGIEGADKLGDELMILAETVYGMATNSLEASIQPTTVVFSRDLVDALRVVAAGQRGRVAGVAQILEPDPLHHLPVADVKTRDDSLRKHRGNYAASAAPDPPTSPDGTARRRRSRTR